MVDSRLRAMRVPAIARPRVEQRTSAEAFSCHRGWQGERGSTDFPKPKKLCVWTSPSCMLTLLISQRSMFSFVIGH